MLALLAYSVLSLLWSPDPLSGMAFIFKFFLCTSIFLCLKKTDGDQLFHIISIAIAVSLAFVLLYIPLEVSYMGSFGNTNLITEYCLMAAPFAGGLAFIYRNLAIRWLAVILVAADVYYLLFHNISKIEFAVIPIVALLAVTVLFWKRAKWSVILTWMASIIIMSMLVYTRWEGAHGFRDSIYPRLEFVINTTYMWLDAPLFGHGVGSFLSLWHLYRENYFSWLGATYKPQTNVWEVLEATHNEYLQFLADFGLIGLIVVLLFGWWMLRGVRANKPDPPAWIGLIAIVVAMVCAAVEFPLQNPATLLLTTIGLAFIARRAQGSFLFDHELTRVYRLVLLAGTAIMVCITGYFTALFYKAETHYSQAFTSANPEYAYRQCVEAYRLSPWNFSYRTNLAIYLYLWAEKTGGRIPVPPEEYDAAFEIGRSAPSTALLFTEAAYLVNSGRYVEKKEEMEKRFAQLRQIASRSPDVWLLYAYYNVLTNNDQEANNALAHAQRLSLAALQQGQFAQIQAILAARISSAKIVP
ncbi:MAG: O-antigen ligase family protein [Sulfuricellaceae bacterium]